MDYKQVIIVRTDLNMSAGKLAAQVAHASISAYRACESMTAREAWYHEGQRKIVLAIDSEFELQKIFELAIDNDLPASIIKDFGMTELPPNTVTTVGIGPDINRKIDIITSRLPLLR